MQHAEPRPVTDQDYKLLDGRAVAAEVQADIADAAHDLAAAGWPPKLVSIAVGNSDAATLYIRNQKRVSAKLGIDFEDRYYDELIGRDELLGIVNGLNTDPRITGVIIQRPVPAHLSIRELQSAVHPLKDVEGMHPSSIGNIVYNDLVMGPCTSVAAVELLKRTGLRLEGLEVVIIGHSEIVGKPIAFLLMSEGATITVCHHMTRNLRVHSRQADAVIVAVGKAGLVTGDMIKPGAAVIDIGINQVEMADGSSCVVGDVDHDSCLDVAGWLTPVPGGVGPVTVAILMRNAVTAARLQKQHYETALGSGNLENNADGRLAAGGRY